MDEHTRHHDPDQIVPSETGPAEGVHLPQAHEGPETEHHEIERRRPLPSTGTDGSAAPPPRQGFWGSLTETERAALLASAEEVVYPVGTVLWSEGQAADQAVVIRSGSIRVSVTRDGRERIIAFRGPGDIVGERAALLLRRRSATIVAMDTVHGLRLTTQQFVTYLSDHPRVVAIMEREVYDRLTELNGLSSQTAQPYYTAEQHEPLPYTPGADYETQPYASTAQPYASTPQPYPSTPQPYPSTPQPYPSTPAPLIYPAVDPRLPYAGAGGGTPYLVPPPAGGSWPVRPVAATRVPSHAQPTQPMAINPPEPSGPSWAGQNCTIVYTDIAGFSASHRNDVHRLDMRRAMYALLREAFEESKVPWDACHIEDRGDGALIVIPPEVPTAAVIDPMINSLAVRLRRHNRRASGAVRIQLRVAVHVGPVMPDPPGVSGWALIRAARLLDARPLKDRLAATGADLGFIASPFVYESVIAHSPGYVNPAEYEPISCRVKKLKLEGWIHLRGVPAQSAV